MTSSKKQFPLFFLLFFLFLFPLQHASNPRKCSSSYSEPLRCRPSEVPIRFPLCGHKGFNLRCNVLKKTIIELPMSGTFLVENIDYGKQQISIKDPEKCLAKRLLNLNISGSAFSHRFDMIYTFLACPNEAVLPTWSPTIPCLRNSTTTFFATPNYNLAQSMLPSCQIVRRLHALANSPFKEIGFSSYLINDVSFLLEWDTPNCKGCEAESLRCGNKNKASLEVICIVAEGSLSNKSKVIILCVSIVGGVIFFNVCLGCIGCYMYNSEGSDSPRQRIAAIEAAAALAPQPRGTIVRTGLDQSTIESYKKMELGESRRLPETNGIVCPICLSEYASKETVRFIPECNHCFHVDCIDVWLKIHGSCPLCRSSHA